MHEKGHAENGKDEHYEKEEEANVEQRWQRHGQGKQQCPNALGTLHQTQHSTDFRDTHYTKQRRRYKVLLDDVTKHQAWGDVKTINLISNLCTYR